MNVFFEQVILLTATQLALTVGVFFVYGNIVHNLQKKILTLYFTKVGWKGILLTAWIGTPVHELSHAIMAWTFGHRVNKIKLFEPDFETMQLGYVSHSHKKLNPIHKLGLFFIGGAPLIFGPLVILVLLFWLQPEIYNMLKTQQFYFHPAFLFDPLFYLFFYLAFSISSHISPSKKDIRQMKKGFTMMVVFLFILSMIFVSTNITYIVAYNHITTALLGFGFVYGVTILILLLHLFLLHMFRWLFGGKGKKKKKKK